MHRRALQRVHRTFIGEAVLLEAALEQNGHRGFAARGWTQQQQQSTTDIRAGGGCFEVIHDATERLIDAEQFALEQFFRAGRLAIGVAVRTRTAIPVEHVPQILMTGARELARIAGNDGAEEFAERAGPVLRTVEPAIGAQGFNEAFATLRGGPALRACHRAV